MEVFAQLLKKLTPYRGNINVLILQMFVHVFNFAHMSSSIEAKGTTNMSKVKFVCKCLQQWNLNEVQNKKK